MRLGLRVMKLPFIVRTMFSVALTCQPLPIMPVQLFFPIVENNCYKTHSKLSVNPGATAFGRAHDQHCKPSLRVANM